MHNRLGIVDWRAGRNRTGPPKLSRRLQRSMCRCGDLPQALDEIAVSEPRRLELPDASRAMRLVLRPATETVSIPPFAEHLTE